MWPRQALCARLSSAPNPVQMQAFLSDLAPVEAVAPLLPASHSAKKKQAAQRRVAGSVFQCQVRDQQALLLGGSPCSPATRAASVFSPSASDLITAVRAQVPGCTQGQEETAVVSRCSHRYRLCGVHLYADALTLRPGAPPVRFCQARACARPRS